MLSGVLSIVGTVLVGVGLYRRDPGAQRRVRRAWGWFKSKVLRRRQPASGVGAAKLTIDHDMSAEGMTPPLVADPSRPILDRVGRLEENIEISSSSIRAQAAARREGDRRVTAKIDAVAESLRGHIEEVRRLADEASVPERTEWWGLGFLVVGASLAPFSG